MGKTKRREAAKASGSGKADRASAPKASKAAKKKKGRGWGPQLETELDAIGLRVQEVDADGSCFFRSLADQLEGRVGDHRALRRRVVAHISENRSLYEPFVEDDEPFDDYVGRMGEEGTWAGHLELQAASVCLGANLRVYQADQPPWTVKNFPDDGNVPMLHLSYHDGSHYNSVRVADDYGDGPPLPIPLALAPVAADGSDGGPEGVRWSDSDVKRVREGTGCRDEARVTVALETAGGNVDAAIEALVEAMCAEDGESDTVANGAEGVGAAAEAAAAAAAAPDAAAPLEKEPPAERLVEVQLDVSRGGKGRRVAVRLRVLGEDGDDGDASADASPSPPAGKRTKASKKKGGKGTSRNSRCPCGSSKKYKNCCGASKSARAPPNDKGEGAAVVAAAMQTLYI